MMGKKQKSSKCEFCEANKNIIRTQFLICGKGGEIWQETELIADINGTSMRLYDTEFPGLLDSAEIRFCPMCGRALNK